MKTEIEHRLDLLLKSIQRDRESLRQGNVRYPEAEALFDQLFDAAQSTLQNTLDSSADEPE
jgi:hypothetical protein